MHWYCKENFSIGLTQEWKGREKLTYEDNFQYFWEVGLPILIRLLLTRLSEK